MLTITASATKEGYNPGQGQTQLTVKPIVQKDITSPTVSVTVSPSLPYTTQTVTFTVTANDNEGGSGLATVELSVDGSLVQKWTTSGTHTCTDGPYYKGTHTFSVLASDNEGNEDDFKGSFRVISPTTPTFSVAVDYCGIW